MLNVICWVIFGLVVGSVARLLYRNPDDPQGCLPTIVLGISGSCVGGFIHWAINRGDTDFTPAGFIMSVVGAILCCWFAHLFRKS